MDSADKKSELSTKLKEICSEIESKDGRKVELIKRVVVSTKFNKSTAYIYHIGVATGDFGGGEYHWHLPLLTYFKLPYM